jgi:protein tyrosine/serine phosphatase
VQGWTKHVRRAIAVALVIAAIPVGILLYQQALRLMGNFHTVVAGQLYRSAQLSPSALESYIRDYGIRTVVNLRGPQPGASWYDGEKRITGSLGVRQVDFWMSATRDFTPDQASALLAAMKAAPKPILVHCRDGADRTGLVSVLYANKVAGVSADEAAKQLSPYYGHFGIPVFSATVAMDLSWDRLRLALADP